MSPHGARFTDRVAVVTGGSSGIGRATVDRLHSEGAHVLVADIQGPVDEPFADGIEFENLDVSDAAGWERIVSGLMERRGRIDMLICCAGTTNMETLHEESTEGWQRVIAVNQTGIFLAMRSVIPHMLEAGKGTIVNVSSHFAVIAVPTAVSYHASKGAVTSLSRNAAITYASRGIRVNCVHPGPTETPLVTSLGDEMLQAVVAMTPIGRLAKPEEQAAAIAWLASDDSSYVTGASVLVDGGYTAA